MQGLQVQSLVGELRFYMLQSQKTQNTEQKQYCNKFNKDLQNYFNIWYIKMLNLMLLKIFF